MIIKTLTIITSIIAAIVGGLLGMCLWLTCKLVSLLFAVTLFGTFIMGAFWWGTGDAGFRHGTLEGAALCGIMFVFLTAVPLIGELLSKPRHKGVASAGVSAHT